ncbi:MAG: endonuclease/exonuclease/phosphatase family protein [Pseudomonadota bacterium]
MPKIRIATFNCENLFARYRFGKNVPAPMAEFTVQDIAFEVHSTRAKRITAKAIKAINADIICLQEVESQPVMDRFNSQFLAWSTAKRYRYRVLVDGNDPRHIDVGFLSRYPIKSIRSHRHDRTENNRANVFSRDCLKVVFDVDGYDLTIYGNHFKSMMGGRDNTRDRRMVQVERVHDILVDDWGDELLGDFVVLGDLNDYPEAGGNTTTALSRLLDDPNLINVNDRLPAGDRWTHYWNREDEYRQLDYLLLSKQLDDASGNPAPGRELRGMPWRADDVEDERFEDVGHDDPKASDHVPLFVDVLVGEANA